MRIVLMGLFLGGVAMAPPTPGNSSGQTDVASGHEAEACGESFAANSVARAFFHALGRLQWEPLSQHLDPRAVVRFDEIAMSLVGGPRGDSVVVGLYSANRQEFNAWSPRERFVRSMLGMTQYSRGLMESQVMTDVEILGEVGEGSTICHVVYREATDHGGLVVDEVSVLTLGRGEGRWLVLRNTELEILATALRGIPIGRTPPEREESF